nr:MAG TPA_asm: hypothetical protein [Caudoviricetes sp.]
MAKDLAFQEKTVSLPKIKKMTLRQQLIYMKKFIKNQHVRLSKLSKLMTTVRLLNQVNEN